MGLRLGSGALGCRASVEEGGAVPVGRQDRIRVWGALGSGGMETLEDFPGCLCVWGWSGGDGSCGW